MSFFTGSSYLSISGGTFTIISPTTRDGSRNSDGLVIVQANEVDLQKELISGNRYRIYSASHAGRSVAVKTFEGPRAKQDWTTDIDLSKKVFHPNVLKIVGISDESSKNRFVLFHGITSEQKMQSLIAKALRTELNMSVQLSMKAVRGIAAGLSYLKFHSIPIHEGELNFDIFIGHENEPILSFHLSNTTDDDDPASQNFDIQTGDRGIEVLNRLCQQLFSGANSILYDDSPERNFDAYDRESLPTATLEDVQGTSNLYESEATSNPSSSTEKSKSNTTPRREVWWLDLGGTNQCLESIKRCFENYLDRFLISSSHPLLRRIRSPGDNNLRRNMHQCPGYLREEITLTSDVSRSAIVSHVFPSESELCSICGQLVQYAYDIESEWDQDMPDMPTDLFRSPYDFQPYYDEDFRRPRSGSPPSSPWTNSSEEFNEDEVAEELRVEVAAATRQWRRKFIPVRRLSNASQSQSLREGAENATELDMDSVQVSRSSTGIGLQGTRDYGVLTLSAPRRSRLAIQNHLLVDFERYDRHEISQKLPVDEPLDRMYDDLMYDDLMYDGRM